MRIVTFIVIGLIGLIIVLAVGLERAVAKVSVEEISEDFAQCI